MAEHAWDVHYPQDLVRYIELFRVEYIPYDIYDKLLDEYLRQHVANRSLRVLSLGCGTGQHETNLAGAGHAVLGLDRDEESLRRARSNAAVGPTSPPRFLRADLLAEAELRVSLRGEEPFDVALMLGVQLSMADHGRAAMLAKAYLRDGGLFVAGLWGYDSGFDTNRATQESCVEIAGEAASDYAVRLNTYTYFREGGHHFIDWDAVYLYPGPDNVARIHRRHTDRIEVAPEVDGVDPLGMSADSAYSRLPSRALRECGEAMCLPHTYEYLAGWRKNA